MLGKVVGDGTLLIRADANIAMGTGHVMRCLALAQAWQDAGGRAVFAMADATPAVRARLRAEGFDIAPVRGSDDANGPASQLASLALELGAEWVVVDGYQFGSARQCELKSAGLKVLFVDDYGHAGHYSADLVLNQNVSANEQLYANREPHTRLLLGPRYCMLRREFRAWRSKKREIPAIGHKVLVTMGGSDPANFTARVMQALAAVELEGLQARIVVGGSNPHIDSLQRYANQFAERVALWSSVSNMAELMAWADIAVSSAGTTAWELAFMGVPSVLLAVVEHQSAVAQAVETARVGVNLGWFSETHERRITEVVGELLADGPLRNEMAANGRGLVDGYGVDRVVSVLAESIAAATPGDLTPRLARRTDTIQGSRRKGR